MKPHVFSVRRRNWKGLLFCTNLEKGINNITLLQLIKKSCQIFADFLEHFGINCSIYSRFPQHTLYPEIFLEISEIFYLNILQDWIKVMLHMKDDRRLWLISAITDCNVLTALIGTLKVTVSLERDEYEEFRYISAVRLEIWCSVRFAFFFLKPQNKKII